MNIIEKDEDGRIIHIKRDDGFEEFITYFNIGKIRKIVETHYPQGQIEVEKYVR